MTDRPWLTLRQLDEALGLPKGSAFRVFRRIEPQWREGADFRVLHHRRDREEIEALRSAGRIYASTVNLVLLSPAMAAALRERYARRSTTDPAE